MPFGSGVHISCALLARSTGHRAGGCTGTNLWGAFAIIAELRASGVRGSVVTLLCDGGERYSRTYYDDGWLRAQDMDPEPYQGVLKFVPVHRPTGLTPTRQRCCPPATGARPGQGRNCRVSALIPARGGAGGGGPRRPRDDGQAPHVAAARA